MDSDTCDNCGKPVTPDRVGETIALCAVCNHEVKGDICVVPGKEYNTNIPLMHQDLFHMGTRMGTNVFILHPNHDSQACDYLILVDTNTGKSIRVSFTDKGKTPSMSEQIFNVMGR
jgi:hypothetical protein